jgi:hypothetical protein
MAKSKVIPEKISMVGLRITKSRFEVSKSAIDIPNVVEDIKLGCRSESGFNLDENYQLFKLFIKVQGFGKDGEEVRVEGEYHIDFHFIIENLKDFITKESGEDSFSVDSNLGATIAGIAYSTSRGIILDRTQTTDFNGVIIPVINPMSLLSEDTYSELDLSKKN